MSIEVTASGVPVITTPPFLMNRSNDTAPFNPSDSHLYCYPLFLSTLRYSVGMIHSNAGTLGGIVGRTCTNRAFYEKKNGILGSWLGENLHKIMIILRDTLIQFSRCAYARQWMWQT